MKKLPDCKDVRDDNVDAEGESAIDLEDQLNLQSTMPKDHLPKIFASVTKYIETEVRAR